MYPSDSPSSPLTDLEDLPDALETRSPSPTFAIPSQPSASSPLNDKDLAYPSLQSLRRKIKDLSKPSNRIQVITLPQTYHELVNDRTGGRSSRKARDRGDQEGDNCPISGARKSLVIKTSDNVEVLYLLKNQCRKVSPDANAAKTARAGRKQGKQKQKKQVEKSKKEGLDRIQTSRPHAAKTRYHQNIARSIKSYSSHNPAARKLDANKRHSSTYEGDEAENADGQSVRYFGIWQPPGHAGEGKAGFIAADGIGRVRKGTAAREVMSMLNLLGLFLTIVSLMMKTLQPRAAKYYESAFERDGGTSPFAQTCERALKNCKRTATLFFSTMALVINARVGPHRDGRDSVHGLAAMTVFGEFEGGDLYLPRHQIRIRYNPGDVILFKSNLLEHMVLPFKGNRYAVVLFTHHHLLINSNAGFTDEFLREENNWIPARPPPSTATRTPQSAQPPIRRAVNSTTPHVATTSTRSDVDSSLPRYIFFKESYMYSFIWSSPFSLAIKVDH
ncbi:hypothetical protein JCM5350_002398 [Sporobolomyces pararoseus]